MTRSVSNLYEMPRQTSGVQGKSIPFDSDEIKIMHGAFHDSTSLNMKAGRRSLKHDDAQLFDEFVEQISNANDEPARDDVEIFVPAGNNGKLPDKIGSMLQDYVDDLIEFDDHRAGEAEQLFRDITQKLQSVTRQA